MSNYTPGPWHTVKHKDIGWDIYGDEDLHNVVGDNGVENEQDALLIASAPDLLQACQAAIELLENPTNFKDCQPAYGLLRGAVNRATKK